MKKIFSAALENCIRATSLWDDGWYCFNCLHLMTSECNFLWLKSYHSLLRFDSNNVFLVWSDDTIPPTKTKTSALYQKISDLGPLKTFNDFSFSLKGGDWLAGDPSSWWEPRHLFSSQDFDHIQKVRVLIFGLLNNFCGERLSNWYSYEWRCY